MPHFAGSVADVSGLDLASFVAEFRAPGPSSNFQLQAQQHFFIFKEALHKITSQANMLLP